MRDPLQQPGALPAPRTAAGREGLAALLAEPRSALIATDFDGTLSPIVADPAAARPHPDAAGVLRRLAPLCGTLAVITGRPALEVVRRGLGEVPGLLVLGHYGRQRWQDGSLASLPAPPGLAEARRQLPAVLAAAGAQEGVWIEEKGEAVAVHTRRAAEPAAALERMRAPLEELAARTGLVAEPGRLVIELRPPGSDKGLALTKLAAERGATTVVFCGDDLGDRPAFAAVSQLRADGTAGLTVCSSSAEVTGLAQEADLVVEGPEGVVALLGCLAAALEAAAR